MFELSIAHIQKSYKTVKNKAFDYYRLKNIDKLIEHVDISAVIAASFNWIFTDTEVEDTLKDVAREYISIDTEIYLPNSKKIVFYDQIGTTACLGLQYLRGLMAADYEIFYIFESNSRKCSPQIINDLVQYKKAQYIIVDSSKNGKIDILNDLYRRILEFSPQKAIIHSPAEGAFGVVLWNALCKIERYRIVPGDHHFYLGVSCTDYFFEFRKYGYTVAMEKRDIPKEKILIQPYYPIIDNDKFYGFPEQAQNKLIVFSAGSLYKTYGENDLFFNILKRLLDHYPQLIILFAGDGFDVPFKKFIKNNNFQNRLVLLGYRSDLNMCIANSDVYLTTFPFTGGLTTQFAAFYSKPILSYTTKEFCGNHVEDIIASPALENDKCITYTDFDELFVYVDRIINDRVFRLKEGERNNHRLTTKKEFDAILCENLYDIKPQVEIPRMSIDYDKHIKFYVDIENFYIPTMKSFLFNRFKFDFFRLFPYLVIPTFSNPLFLSKIINSMRK